MTLLERYEFDRAVLDYSMPHPNGYQVLGHIRTTSKLNSLWVGLMISESDWETIKDFPYKPDWVSAKPLNPTDLT